MEILKKIGEICDQHEYCGSCPLWCLSFGRNECVFDLPPNRWNLDKIKKALASNEPNNAHKGDN